MAIMNIRAAFSRDPKLITATGKADIRDTVPRPEEWSPADLTKPHLALIISSRRALSPFVRNLSRIVLCL